MCYGSSTGSLCSVHNPSVSHKIMACAGRSVRSFYSKLACVKATELIKWVFVVFSQLLDTRRTLVPGCCSAFSPHVTASVRLMLALIPSFITWEVNILPHPAADTCLFIPLTPPSLSPSALF